VFYSVLSQSWSGDGCGIQPVSKPVPFIPKGSLPGRVKEENESET